MRSGIHKRPETGLTHDARSMRVGLRRADLAQTPPRQTADTGTRPITHHESRRGCVMCEGFCSILCLFSAGGGASGAFTLLIGPGEKSATFTTSLWSSRSAKLLRPEPRLSGCQVLSGTVRHCQVPLSETSCQVLSVLSGAVGCLSDIQRGSVAVGCCRSCRVLLSDAVGAVRAVGLLLLSET